MTGCYSIDHFVTEFSDIAFSINLILLKCILGSCHFVAYSLEIALSLNFH